MKAVMRIVSLIVSVVLLMAIIVLPTSATSIEEADCCETVMNLEGDSVTPRAKICPSCGNALKTTYGGWSAYVSVGSAPCTHGYRHGEDKLLERYRTKVESCVYCEYAVPSTETQKSRECHGFN